MGTRKGYPPARAAPARAGQPRAQAPNRAAPAGPLRRARYAVPVTGLYVHVPFCSALCPYCDFAVVVGRREQHERYADALLAEFEAAAWPERFETIFIGGGTPTFVDPALLARVLAAPGPAAEVTIEANPESTETGALRALAERGVNRVSIGAQSFAPHVLRALGRTHTAADIPRAVGAARAAGIDNVSLDLIYGSSGESVEDWRATLQQAIALGVEHLSCYALTIEERTAFGTAVARGTMTPPDEDALAERYEVACELLARAGFEHYEISNWARPGRESRHNLIYWTQGDYLGLGLGAHSHRQGHRWWNTRALQAYLADPARARAGEETLTPEQRADEWLQLRLRLIEGVDVAEAETRLARKLSTPTRALQDAGLATLDQGRLHLTTRGMLLENEVALRLLGATRTTTP